MDDPLLAVLREEHPDWQVRVLPGGMWMATRRRCVLSDDEHVAGLACTLLTDSGRELGEELAGQRLIEDGMRENA